jgi:hypothetical protein
MDNLAVLLEMRKTLNTMRDSLTSSSSYKEHEKYYGGLIHYRSILNTHFSSLDKELLKEIEISYKNKSEAN